MLVHVSRTSMGQREPVSYPAVLNETFMIPNKAQSNIQISKTKLKLNWNKHSVDKKESCQLGRELLREDWLVGFYATPARNGYIAANY